MHTCSGGEGLDDWEEGVGRQSGRFIGMRINNGRRGVHDVSAEVNPRVPRDIDDVNRQAYPKPEGVRSRSTLNPR